MVSKIIWTEKAKKELIEIFDYWNCRNSSKAFSIRLNTLIYEQLKLIVEFPEIERKTEVPKVFVKIIQKYLLYYEFDGDVLYILTIRRK